MSAWLSASRPAPAGPAPHSSGGGTMEFVYSFIYLECVCVCVYVGASSCRGTCREVREQLAAIRSLFLSRGSGYRTQIDQMPRQSPPGQFLLAQQGSEKQSQV